MVRFVNDSGETSLGLNNSEIVNIINLKCDPVLNRFFLIKEKGYFFRLII